MRSTLYLAAVVVTRYNQVIRLYYQRLPEAGKNQESGPDRLRLPASADTI